MSLKNTIIGLRKDTSAVLASDGLTIHPSGIVLNHRSTRLRRLYRNQVLVGSTFAEPWSETLLDCLSDELARSGGDVRACAVKLGLRIRESLQLRQEPGELIIVSQNTLIGIGPSGETSEPDEGFLAIGSGALVAYGAVHALLKHTTLSPEHLLREAMLIVANLWHLANDQVFVESVGGSTTS